MNDDLKLCPFCGNEAELNSFGKEAFFNFIACINCGCGTKVNVDKNILIEAWNNHVKCEECEP